jgi:eukaryotic-like serine/threonine-protein kinase
LLLLENGRAAEAVAEFAREASIRTRLVHENRSVHFYGYALANCLNNTANALIRLGRPAEARARCEQAMGLLEPLVKDHPETAMYREGLAESWLRSGMARRDEGDARGAAAECRRADALLEAIGVTNPEATALHACCHASLSWAAGRPGSGVSAGESGAEAAKAMTLLRHAADMGFRDLATYRHETGLDPLRDRPEFRMLMLDLAFPGEPMAPERRGAAP